MTEKRTSKQHHTAHSNGKQKRRQAASILGKFGGSKGGTLGSMRLSRKQRQERARKAAIARWQKKPHKSLDIAKTT